MAGSHELNLTAECISDIADPITRISEHPDCRRTYQAGWNEMVELATHAAKSHEFHGKMESVPYCALVDGKVEIVSGHHRIRAAREAGITEAPILVDESGLVREEIVAKQLAHNRLSGFDDEATLKQLFASLDDPSLILESGLADDLMVLPHVDLAVGITPMLDMDWKVITLTFLPHQIENFNAVIDMMPSSDMVGLAPLSDYQRFIDALIKWGRYKNVRNVGTALALLADIAFVELAAAEEEEEEDAKSVG